MERKIAQRSLIAALALADEAIDEVVYRPAVVCAFRWVPRWWLCDAAKVSMWLADRWRTGWWREHRGVEPAGPCAACRRRAAVHVFDAPNGSEVAVCGWCRIGGPILTADDLSRELAAAAAESVSWHWSIPASE